MTTEVLSDADPVRAAILAAMDRLLGGTPERSQGRLNISQLAVEADVKRWYLTHQHTDLKDLFQARVSESAAGRAASAKTATDHEELKTKHAELQQHCAFLEARLQVYATAINLLTLENAALSGRTEGASVTSIHHREPPDAPHSTRPRRRT
ncbi:hypothetical protein ACWC5I_01115 [Kitasatospora sp. NPDC001574]